MKKNVNVMLWDSFVRKSEELGIPLVKLVCGYARQPIADHGTYYSAVCALDGKPCGQMYGAISQECPVYKKVFFE